jgi:thiol-disulfide isomerase/thioredoxin
MRPQALAIPPEMHATIRAYDGTLNGKPATHVTESITQGATSVTLHFYVDRATQAPLQIGFVTSRNGAAAGSMQAAFSGFTMSDTPLPDSTFQYTPPATMTAFTPQASPQEQPILANGSVAPDFAVADVKGQTIHLKDFAGKVVVIDFWSTWCGPCQMSLPGTDKVAKIYQAKGVVFLPICSWDDKSAFTPWVKKHSDWAMTFYFDPAGKGDNSIAATLFKVSGIPTQFVIGKDGKVAAGFVGYDEDTGEKNLTAAIDKALAAG